MHFSSFSLQFHIHFFTSSSPKPKLKPKPKPNQARIFSVFSFFRHPILP